jgi:integrase
MPKLNFFGQKSPQPVELAKYITQYANRSRRPREYKRKFWALAEKIKEFQELRETVLMTDSFTFNLFEDFVFHLKNKHNFRNSTMRSYAAQLKTALNAAARDGHKTEMAFHEYKLKTEESVAIYLTTAEIETINALKLKKDAALVRDRFIIGCCTGLRYSDYAKLGTENMLNGTFSLKTKKTGEKVIVPVHWMILDVLKRNNGEFPKYNSSQQNFNKIVKTICRRAKISDPVLVERTEGFKVVKKKLPKHSLVSSHTARRSFATNMYLAGVPVAKIMLCTGHRTESSFFRYIRIDKQENANELAAHPFFKKNTNFGEDKK